MRWVPGIFGGAVLVHVERHHAAAVVLRAPSDQAALLTSLACSSASLSSNARLQRRIPCCGSLNNIDVVSVAKILFDEGFLSLLIGPVAGEDEAILFGVAIPEND